MPSFFRLGFILLGFCISALFPLVAAAQQASTETVTILVNGVSPAGTKIIGSVVVVRTCDDTTPAQVSFNGMVDGRPASFSGTVRERWLGEGKEEIEVLSTDLKGLVLGSSPLRKILVVQTAPNSITLDGVPVAIDGKLEPPCSGRTSYTVTTAGQGTQVIRELPNTASGPIPAIVQEILFQPYVLAGLLIGMGAVCVLASMLLREPKQRRSKQLGGR